MILIDFLLGCFMIFMGGMNCANFIETKEKMTLAWTVGTVLLGLYFLIGVIGMAIE